MTGWAVSPELSSFLDRLQGESPTAFSLLDDELRFVYVNPTMAHLHGVPQDDHPGNPLRHVLPDVDAVVADGLAEVLATGAVIGEIPVSGPAPEGRPADADGLAHWRLSLYPVRDADGVVTGAGVVARQVTEEVLAQRARDAALAEQAVLLAQQRDVSITLQRALLPSPLELADFDVAVRYVPGVAALEVGGDFYDVLHLPDGRTGFVIGDVMGKGLQAAALMGQLRAGLRALAKLDLSPAVVLELLDQLVSDLGERGLATCTYAVLEPGGVFSYARAGHLPLVVRGLAPVDGPVGAPLGSGGAQEAATLVVSSGAVVALFTDGLIEDRTQDLDVGLRDLQAALDHGPDDLEALADHVLEQLGRAHGHDDDVALMLLRAP